MTSAVRKVIDNFYSFAIMIVIAYGAVVGTLFLFQRTLLYQPSEETPSPVDSDVAEMQVVTLQTADGLSLSSWFAPPADGRPVIAYFCGNAGHLGNRAFKARPLLDAGLGVLLVGYRGYGGNPGRPSEEGLLADARAALDFLTEAGFPADRTVLYGESLGTGVAVLLAAEVAASRDPVAAVVLETPYTSIAEVAQKHYPFVPARWLVRDRFDAASRIAGISAPVLMLHAADDRVIPFEFAQKLFEAATEPKESHWFETGGHEGLFDNGAGARVLAFIDKYAGPR